MAVIPVAIEEGAKRSFASAVDWPGWCRSGRTPDDALEALSDAAARYVPIAAAAGLRFPAAITLSVEERVKGSATTDFGAPGAVVDADHRRSTKAGAERQAALVAASWRFLDAVVHAAPASLRKGPRGGGRDRDAVAAHVVDAEVAYASKVGLKHATRDDVLAVLSHPSDGSPLKANGWPSRYAARRIAWHVLDHAWEIEDRS